MFACWVMFHTSVVLGWLFSKLTFSENSFRNTIKVLSSSDPGQEQQSVSPDLCPNCKAEMPTILIFVESYRFSRPISALRFSNIKITANNDFKLVPGQITDGYTCLYTCSLVVK